MVSSVDRSLYSASLPILPASLPQSVHALIRSNRSVEEIASSINAANVNVKEEGLTPLHVAIQQGKLALIHVLLAKGADLTIQTDGLEQYSFLTPLGLACLEKNIDAVRILLEKGANVNSINGRRGRTALHIAAEEGHTEVIQCLLDYKASVNEKNKEGITALYCASQDGKCAAVSLLLKAGAIVDEVNGPDDLSALHIAAEEGHTEVIELLLAHKASVHKKTKEGFTPLYIASVGGKNEAVGLLLSQGADVNEVNDLNDFTALHIAAEKGHTIVIKHLLAKNASLTKKTKGGFTALYKASEKGKHEAVGLLLSQEADVNEANGQSDQTALHAAAFNGYTEVIKLLLSHQASVDKKDKDGFTALYCASQKGKHEAVGLLLSQGADVNEANGQSGQTALHTAAFNGHAKVIELLLSHQASVDKKDKDGFTALFCSAQEGKCEAVKLLLEADAKVNEVNGQTGVTALHIAAIKGHTEVTKLLVAHKNKKGYTALYRASEEGNSEAVKLLLDKGANVNEVNGPENNTALQFAAEKGHTQVMKILLDHKASVNQKDKRGIAPLQFASWHGQGEAIKLLLERGANINAVDSRAGDTALHAAVWQNQTQVVEILLNARAQIIKNGNQLTPFDEALDKGNFEVLNWQQKALLRASEILQEKYSEDQFEFVLSCLYYQKCMHDSFDKSSFSFLYAKCTGGLYLILFSPKLDLAFSSHIESLKKLHTDVKTDLEKLEKKVAFFIASLNVVEALASEIVASSFRENFLVRLRGFIQREVTPLMIRCTSKQETSDPEKEFDDEDVFGLLPKVGLGFANSELKMSAAESYVNLLNASSKDIWEAGLHTGADLRALGISYTLRDLSQELKEKATPDLCLRIAGELTRVTKFLQTLIPFGFEEFSHLSRTIQSLEKLLGSAKDQGIRLLAFEIISFHSQFTISVLRFYLSQQRGKMKALLQKENCECLAELAKKNGENFLKEIYAFKPPTPIPAVAHPSNDNSYRLGRARNPLQP